MKNKFSEEYKMFLRAKAVRDLKDSLMSICRYCGEGIPVGQLHTIVDPDTGKRTIYSPAYKLDGVCNRCLVKVHEGKIKHEWKEVEG